MNFFKYIKLYEFSSRKKLFVYFSEMETNGCNELDDLCIIKIF